MIAACNLPVLEALTGGAALVHIGVSDSGQQHNWIGHALRDHKWDSDGMVRRVLSEARSERLVRVQREGGAVEGRSQGSNLFGISGGKKPQRLTIWRAAFIASGRMA